MWISSFHRLLLKLNLANLDKWVKILRSRHNHLRNTENAHHSIVVSFSTIYLMWHVYAWQRFKTHSNHSSVKAVNLIQLLNGLFLYIICVVCLCIYEIVHRINLSLFVAWKRRGNWLTPYRFLQKVIQFIGDAIWSGCIRRACGHWTVSANDSVNISCSIFELKQQQQQKNGKKNKLWKCVTQYFRANGKKNHRK